MGRAWTRWVSQRPGQTCTLDPLSWPHNAQEAGRAGSQGPLIPVPSESPCQTSEGWLKKLDSVLGHSWALFLSQGGMCDSPSREWGPWQGGGGNRAITVPERAPHTAPGSSQPLVAGPCTSLQQGQAERELDSQELSMDRPYSHPQSTTGQKLALLGA